MTFVVAAVVVALAAVEAPALAERAEAPAPVDRVEAAVQAVLDRRYQRQLPITPVDELAGRAKDGKTPSAPPRKRRAPRRADDPEGLEGRGGGALGGVVRGIVYAVLAIALTMLLLWLVRDVRRGAGDAALDGDAAPDPTIDQGVLDRPIGDADELAGTGRYAEAIHTLLLRTQLELVRATKTRVPASLTSREILARVPLVPDARTALHGLVTAVEVSWFGDDVPAAADYERCRREFQRFADAYRGKA